LKGLGLLVCFERATDTCSFAHACLYLFDKRNKQKLLLCTEKTAVFKTKKGGL
jgi:hypothetical protein